MLSFTEENYLKAIYHLSDGGKKSVLTNELSEALNTKAASVTDMIKKLSAKELISYEKYYGVNATTKGKTEALNIIRKHRLWETFLVEKLGFSWDEVHEVAEQLEHIQSVRLIDKLDEFLGFPKADPHGDLIPDKTGKMESVKQIPLSQTATQKNTILTAVKKDDPTFLKYLNKLGMKIGSKISIVNKAEFDGSHEILIDEKKKAFISLDAAENLLVNDSNKKGIDSKQKN